MLILTGTECNIVVIDWDRVLIELILTGTECKELILTGTECKELILPLMYCCVVY